MQLLPPSAHNGLYPFSITTKHAGHGQGGEQPAASTARFPSAMLTSSDLAPILAAGSQPSVVVMGSPCQAEALEWVSLLSTAAQAASIQGYITVAPAHQHARVCG